jgi:hypothetical protein
MDLIRELDNLPLISIYGFFNETDKKVYIGYAFDTGIALYRNIRELKYSSLLEKGDYDKLEFRIIETLTTRKDIRLRYQYWIEHYSNTGWDMYRSYKAIEFKLSIDVIGDWTHPGTTKVLFRVRLINRRGSKRVVGVFNSQSDMDGFISKYYSNIDGKITCVTLADNDLTREYLNS